MHSWKETGLGFKLTQKESSEQELDYRGPEIKLRESEIGIQILTELYKNHFWKTVNRAPQDWKYGCGDIQLS